jgi:hypothetical protein
LYGITGKPVMIGNINAIPNETEPDPDLQTAGIFPKNPADMRTLHDCFYFESDAVRLKAFADFATGACAAGDEAACRRQAEVIRGNNANADGTAGRAIYDFARKTVFG